jgi:hypothetical protein
MLLKSQQRVYLLAAPHNAGHVTRIQGGLFTVTYDSPGRPKGHSRVRVTYRERQVTLFGTGSPGQP